jgi:hypothetical protein
MTCAAWPKINTFTSHTYDGSFGSYVETISWAYCYFDGGVPRVSLVHCVTGADKNLDLTSAYAPLQITTLMGRINLQVIKGDGVSTKLATTAKDWEFAINTGGLIVGLITKLSPTLNAVYTVGMYILPMILSSSTSESGTTINIQWGDMPNSGKQVQCWGVVRADFMYGNTETFTFIYGQQAGDGFNNWGDTATQTVTLMVGSAGR